MSFNPEFSFSFDGDGDYGSALSDEKTKRQTPWDFSNAAKEVQETHKKIGTTSIDQKIQKVKEGKGVRAQKKKAAAKAAAESEGSGDEESSGDENEVSSDDDEHEGVGDFPDDDDDESADEDEAEGDEDGGEESDKEEEEEEQEEEEHKPRRAKAKSQRAAEAFDEGDSESDESDVEEEEDEAADIVLKQDGKEVSYTAKTFGELQLSRPLLKAAAALGYSGPTPIQSACIPLAMAGRDICGSAKTGSGKTAAFMLPMLERLLHRNRRAPATRVLVLVPTRELAVQVHAMTEKLAQFTDVRAALIVGGLSLATQAAALRSRPEVVVATPARLVDHLHNTHSVGLDQLAALVLDEADRMLEIGFKDQVHAVVRSCPKQRQTLLFSATLSEAVEELASMSLVKPAHLSADKKHSTPLHLIEEVIRVKDSSLKEALLLSLCGRTLSDTGRTIIFSKTKIQAHRLKIIFGFCDLPAVELHGNLTQAQRLASLESFRKEEVPFLIATDVAARGLDITGVETVVNYDAPQTLTNYLHRVGRTARAGRNGRAISFFEEGDRKLLKEVLKRPGAPKIQARVLPQASVAKSRDRIEKLASKIIDVHVEERLEKELRQSEMHAQKAENLVLHAKEIASRPAKTWFQTSKEKKAEQELAAKQARGEFVGSRIDDGKATSSKKRRGRSYSDDEGDSGDENDNSRSKGKGDKREKLLTHKEKKKKEAREDMQNAREDIQKKYGALPGKVRARKSIERQAKQGGLRGDKASRLASEKLGVKDKKIAKKKELFSGDGNGAGKPDKGKGKGGRDDDGAARKKFHGKVIKGRQVGGRKAFKSKARHKRK